MIGIYCIENEISGQAYIGQSNNIKKRWSQHKSNLRGHRHENEHLQRAWDRYGEGAFSFYVVEEAEEAELDDMEMHYIKYFDTFRNGYNMTKGGDATRGLEPWNKGKTHSQETKAKLSAIAKKKTGDKNPFFGKKHSERTKAAISKYRSIAVTDKKTGTIYPSAKYADIMFGGRSSNVSKVLNGQCKTAYGIEWEYK